ncbi:MAG: hypothetical protein ACE5GO_10120 [Anaerolineales bacterium]
MKEHATDIYNRPDDIAWAVGKIKWLWRRAKMSGPVPQITTVFVGDWTYGPYGEILPPFLAAGADPDETLKEMVGEETFEAMPPDERELFYGEAAIYAHQRALERVFAGQTAGDPAKSALHRAIYEGRLISLRPLGYEREQHRAFAPVLRCLGDERWQVGLPERGRHLVLTGGGEQAYLAARNLYVEWTEAEVEGDDE